mgnify:CR=1 FL=1|tara:strand:- start:442 stop:1002 length:561 start_codon:yes stop_codon:yes gene_type:complete
MQKLLVLFSSIFLLAGCVESMALLGPATSGATNGKLVQSSLKSAVSYGVKKQTGKTPLQHALAYAEENNPTKKKEKCISFIEKTNSEACMIVKKKIASTQDALVKKISTTKNTVVKKISSTQNFIKKKKQVDLEKTVKNEKKAEYSIKLKKSAVEFASVVRAKIKEYDARWLDRIEQSRQSNHFNN